MIEKVTDLWTEPCDARCITTNGFVKGNNNLVMGAGVAGQAQERYPSFPKIAGQLVKEKGNHVHLIMYGHEAYFTFPVKHVWYEKAELQLIKRSAVELIEFLDDAPEFQKVLLPLPGCGNGKLTWAEVKPVIEPILDDRVCVINNKPFEWPASF